MTSRCVLAALAVATMLTAHAPAVMSQGRQIDAAGTYEITWFSVSSATEQPTVATLLLVLSPTPIPDSIRARMNSGHARYDAQGLPSACWRITKGSAVLNGGPSIAATYTDWSAIAADSVAVQLWFHTDAGSMLRFRLVGDSLRGQISSVGYLYWPSGFERRTVRDSVAGRRVDAPDIDRCLR